MLLLVCALRCEAEIFIRRFSLKRVSAETKVALFARYGGDGSDCTAATDVRVLLCGVGEIAAATAVTYYYTKYGYAENDVLLNIGTCASRAAVGTVFRVHKITETTGKTFYSDINCRSDILCGEIATISKVIGQSEIETKLSDNLLFDMESAGIFQAASRFLCPHQIQFIKVVSDNGVAAFVSASVKGDDGSSGEREREEKRLGNGGKDIMPTPQDIITLFEANEDVLFAEVEKMRRFSEWLGENASEQTARQQVVERETARLATAVHASETMTHQIRQMVTYLVLTTERTGGQEPNGENVSAIIDRLFQDGILPCPDKKSGKRVWAELREEWLVETNFGTSAMLAEGKGKDRTAVSAFSHIYIETEVKDHPRTAEILAKFPAATTVEIAHYKDLFDRGHQNVALQKQSQSLILAKKSGGWLQKGAPVCQDFGNQHFYYVSCVMNCVFDCAYCYLKGMYPSGNLVVFVNIEDAFAEVEAMLKQHPVYLCVSYDTDLLALENLLGFVKKWEYFAKSHADLTIEVRTKAALRGYFTKREGFEEDKKENLTPQGQGGIETAAVEKTDTREKKGVEKSPLQHKPRNVIYAFTLSPQPIIEQCEKGAPSLAARLSCIKTAQKQGAPVRLCFDPLLFVPHWKTLYQTMLEEIAAAIDFAKVRDISLGAFRIPQDYLKNMRRRYPSEPIAQFPYENRNGIAAYSEKIEREMTDFLKEQLAAYVPEERVFLADWE